MFEVGRDIFKHGFSGMRGNVVARKRLGILNAVFLAAFVLFIGRTLQLGIQGPGKILSFFLFM